VLLRAREVRVLAHGPVVLPDRLLELDTKPLSPVGIMQPNKLENSLAKPSDHNRCANVAQIKPVKIKP
jgi:hypothetical protein